MHVICTQENLRNGLQIVSRIISGSNTLPILNNVLLKTENGLLKISATNLELAINTYIRCKVEEEGSVCVPAKTITDLISSLPSTNISLKKNEGVVLLETENYKTSIHSLPTEEFPLIPTIEKTAELIFSAPVLKQALESVVFAASTSETQPEISGILLKQSGQGVVFVATDRYRLAEHTSNVTIQGNFKDMIIPHKAAGEIMRLIGQGTGESKIQVSDNQISFVSDDTTVISRLIDGQYPGYTAIIPTEFNTVVTTNMKALLQALKTSGIFSRATNSVVISCDSGTQKLIVRASSSDVGESMVEIPSEIKGPDTTITFNYRYVTDALQILSGDEVELRVVSDAAPVIIAPKNNPHYLYLVMPIKS
jgi:DNA polymerase-3 subunit beta